MRVRDHGGVQEGDRLGAMVVIDVLDDGAVRCRCDCGKRVRFPRAVEAKSARSCGCIRRAVPKNESNRLRRGVGRPAEYPLDAVEMIRNAPATITGRQLAQATGMSEQNVSKIRRRVSRKEAA